MTLFCKTWLVSNCYTIITVAMSYTPVLFWYSRIRVILIIATHLKQNILEKCQRTVEQNLLKIPVCYDDCSSWHLQSFMAQRSSGVEQPATTSGHQFMQHSVKNCSRPNLNQAESPLKAFHTPRQPLSHIFWGFLFDVYHLKQWSVL